MPSPGSAPERREEIKGSAAKTGKDSGPADDLGKELLRMHDTGPDAGAGRPEPTKETGAARKETVRIHLPPKPGAKEDTGTAPADTAPKAESTSAVKPAAEPKAGAVPTAGEPAADPAKAAPAAAPAPGATPTSGPDRASGPDAIKVVSTEDAPPFKIFARNGSIINPVVAETLKVGGMDFELLHHDGSWFARTKGPNGAEITFRLKGCQDGTLIDAAERLAKAFDGVTTIFEKDPKNGRDVLSRDYEITKLFSGELTQLAHLKNVHVEDQHWTGLDLRALVVHNSTFENVSVNAANLDGAEFTACKINKLHAQYASMKDVDFGSKKAEDKTTITSSHFIGTAIEGMHAHNSEFLKNCMLIDVRGSLNHDCFGVTDEADRVKMAKAVFKGLIYRGGFDGVAKATMAKVSEDYKGTVNSVSNGKLFAEIHKSPHFKERFNEAEVEEALKKGNRDVARELELTRQNAAGEDEHLKIKLNKNRIAVLEFQDKAGNRIGDAHILANQQALAVISLFDSHVPMEHLRKAAENLARMDGTYALAKKKEGAPAPSTPAVDPAAAAAPETPGKTTASPDPAAATAPAKEKKDEVPPAAAATGTGTVPAGKKIEPETPAAPVVSPAAGSAPDPSAAGIAAPLGTSTGSTPTGKVIDPAAAAAASATPEATAKEEPKAAPAEGASPTWRQRWANSRAGKFLAGLKNPFASAPTTGAAKASSQPAVEGGALNEHEAKDQDGDAAPAPATPVAAVTSEPAPSPAATEVEPIQQVVSEDELDEKSAEPKKAA